MQVMAASLPGSSVHIVSRRRKDPLPRPLASSIWILARQVVRELHPARAGAEVVIVKLFRRCDVGRQLLLDSVGEHGPAIARALAPPDDDLVARKIDVLNAEATALQ